MEQGIRSQEAPGKGGSQDTAQNDRGHAPWGVGIGQESKSGKLTL